MNLTPAEERELLSLMEDDVDSSDVLTDWERQFLGNTLDRYATYGRKTMISQPQWDIIRRISEKYYKQ